jgi:hypothetical protein
MKKAQIIPPLSILRLVRADADTPQWKKQIGRLFRVGYYSRQDGTNCLWLVNDKGEYEQTIDQSRLHRYFALVQKSSERSLYGANRPPIPPLSQNGKHASTPSRSPVHA